MTEQPCSLWWLRSRAILGFSRVTAGIGHVGWKRLVGGIALRSAIGLWLNRAHFFRVKVTRKNDLEHLDIFAVTQLAVPDFRRLMHT